MPSYHESRIDTVTVHRRGAVVSRVVDLATVPTDPLRLGPLPMSIDDASLRVSIEAQGNLHATDLRVVLDAPDADASLPPARPEDLLEAKREARRLADTLHAVERERERMQTLPTVTRPSSQEGVEPPPSPAASRLALLSLRDARLRDADERHRRVGEQLRDAKRVLADLLEREARASSMRRTEPGELRKAVEISLRGDPGEGPVAVRIEYRVDAARWAPTYALRLDPGMSTSAVEVRAMIAQRSGEDWHGVQLALSTASLEGWAELPELTSLRIGRRQSTPAKSGWRPAPVGTDALFGDFDRERDHWDRAEAEHRKEAPVTKAPGAAMAMRAMEQGAPPQAAPAAAPAPRMRKKKKAPPRPLDLAANDAPTPQSMARSGGMPSPAAPPHPGMLKSTSFGAGASLAPDELAGLEEEEPEPTAQTVDKAMLDYGCLRMPAPGAGERGRLVLRTRTQLYVEHMQAQEIEVDLGAALAAIDRGSREVHRAALPAGCRPPSASGFDYVYRATGRLDVPSDGVFHNLALTRREGAARARFVVVPRESRDAFRFVEIDNPLETPLLDGPVDVFVGGDFLMTGELREVPEGGVLRLGLGVEQRLKVSRNARFSEKSGGLMGGKLDLLHSVEVELENLLPRDAEIEVRERWPVLREDEDDIRFEPGDVSPAWTEWEPEDQPELEGGHRWKVVVPPGEKRTLRASYAIRIASKHELVGGNRREA